MRLLPQSCGDSTPSSQFPPDPSGLVLLISNLLHFLLTMLPHFIFNNPLAESQIGCTGEHTLLLFVKQAKTLKKSLPV